MKVAGFDMEQMFADAVNASENTGENDLENYSKKAEKNIKKDVKIEVKEESQLIEKEDKLKKVEQTKVELEHPRIEPEHSRIEEPKVEKKERLGPLINSNNQSIIEGIDVNSISRIIEMKNILDNYNATELNFVKGYFQNENGTHAEIIFQALTADYRGLDALNKIVAAREYTAADRAFYLMELDNNSIGDIYDQVDLLTGELGESGRVSEINKIKVCRVLEKAIADMAEDVFTYIHKLQEFTNKAISK